MTSTLSRYSQPLKVTAFLFVAFGGLGRKALVELKRTYHAAGRPFPQHSLILDTDTNGETEGADATLFVGLDGAALELLQSDPDYFGEYAKIFTAAHGNYAAWEFVDSGSRTFRPLSWVAANYRRNRIIRQLNRSIRLTQQESGATHIQPVFFGSTGGGCGSALMIWLTVMLANPRFRALCTRNLLPRLLLTPMINCSEPSCYINEASEPQKSHIIANSYAFRMEAAWLQQLGALKYCSLNGLSNRVAVVDSLDDIARNLGLGTFMYALFWSHIQARFADNVHTAMRTSRYALHNIPESMQGELNLSFASSPRERKFVHDDDRFILETVNGNHHKQESNNG